MNHTINFQNGVAFKVLNDGFEVVSVDGTVVRFDKKGNILGDMQGMCKSEKVNLARVFEGHYVLYNPSVEEHVVPKEKTGDTEEQVFNPHMHTLWRILRNDGTRWQLIPVRSVGTLALNGVAGFEHGVDALNELAAAFVNPKYAELGECIGNSIASRNANNNMTGFSLEAAIDSVYTDDEWRNDYFKLGNKYFHKFNEPVYLASRKTLKHKETRIGEQSHCIMEIGSRKGHNINVLFTISKEGEVDGFRVISGVVPKITLKPDVRFVSGDGSEERPWRLEI